MSRGEVTAGENRTPALENNVVPSRNAKDATSGNPPPPYMLQIHAKRVLEARTNMTSACH